MTPETVYTETRVCNRHKREYPADEICPLCTIECSSCGGLFVLPEDVETGETKWKCEDCR